MLLAEGGIKSGLPAFGGVILLHTGKLRIVQGRREV